MSEFGVGLPRDSWLKTSITTSPDPIVVECDLDQGPADPEVHVIDTEIQCLVTTWKGSATGRCQGETVWTAELAKVRQWMARSQADWPEIYLAISIYSDLARESEDLGFRTWAWDTLDSLRVAGSFSLLVGPTPLETCPTFCSWLHWSEHPGD